MIELSKIKAIAPPGMEFECKCLPDVLTGGVPCKGCLRTDMAALVAEVERLRAKIADSGWCFDHEHPPGCQCENDA